MKKFKVILTLALFIGTTGLAMADACRPVPYHAPVRYGFYDRFDHRYFVDRFAYDHWVRFHHRVNRYWRG